MIAFPQRDRGSFYAPTPDVCSSCNLIRAFCVTISLVFLYSNLVFFNGTVIKQKFEDRFVEVKLSVLSLGACIPSVFVGPVMRLPSS